MNNVIQRVINVNGTYQALSSQKVIASVTISTPPTNTAGVYFKGDTNQDVPWVAGEFHEFKNVDLSQIQVKGQSGDRVTVIGGTW